MSVKLIKENTFNQNYCSDQNINKGMLFNIGKGIIDVAEGFHKLNKHKMKIMKVTSFRH